MDQARAVPAVGCTCVLTAGVSGGAGAGMASQGVVVTDTGVMDNIVTRVVVIYAEVMPNMVGMPGGIGVNSKPKRVP